MSLVLDSSLTLAWFLEDESNDIATAILYDVVDQGAVVPSLWRFEVANGLEMAIRRKRIDAPYRDRALSNLAALRIRIDPESDGLAWSATVKMAGRHRLTVYDAAYLELAQRRRLPLATLNAALACAAEASGVRRLGA